MPHSIIQTDADLESYHALQRTLKKPFTAQHKQGADRSLDQNSLQWLWAGEAAAQRGDMTADEVQSQWKLQHGIPILRSENEDYRAWTELALRPLSYEDRLKAMKFTPVSSKMTVPQMRQYLDTIQRECAEQGIRLTDPERQPA